MIELKNNNQLNTISLRENAAIVKNHIKNRGIKRT